MATIGGPNTEKDNLVFGYDTGYGIADNNTATRFYAGKSVDNGFYNSGANGNILDHSSAYGGYGTVQTGALDAYGTTQNAVYRNTGKIRLGPTGGQDIGTLTNGNTYTWSIYLKHVAGQTESTTMEFDIVDRADSRSYSGTLGSNMTYEWKRFSVTALHNNNVNYHFLDLGTYQGTNVFDWCMPQIELGTVASPFTSTERSSTQSLIDLKKTTDIDVSNISFDSTGQPTFDGTDDYLNLGNSSVFDFGQTGTIEAVLKPTNSTGNSRLWCIDNNSSNLDAYLNSSGYNVYLHGGAVGTTTSLTQNQYNHLVVRYDNGTIQIYINGAAGTMTGTTTGYNILNNSGNNSNLYLGCYRNLSYNFPGEIPIFRVYNSALNVNEIAQNFNAYKNRFGI